MTPCEFDQIDARLLDLIQRDFPLVARPFDHMATRLGVSQDDVLERVSRLKSERVIRQISAIFDSSALGYSSALVTFRVRPELLEQVAANVALHTGVSHCYSRDAELNLWFTITLPPELDIDHEAAVLAQTEGVERHFVLPALRIFKIGVFFEMGEGAHSRESTQGRHSGAHEARLPLSEIERTAVRALQKDIPLLERPFAELAAGVGLPEDELLSRAVNFIETGVMRRFAAVLWHQRAGYRSNAMVCWRADGDTIEAAGMSFADHPAVSHCYERDVYPEWPYSLYTMVHARDDEELARVISELAAASGLQDFRVLRSVKEYKKSRVVYFE